jgi:DNA-directed RNA polymerase subunit beta
VRHNNEYPIVPTGQIDYMDVSPQQLVSVATADDPVPGERRRQPGADGREHAAPGRADAAPGRPVVKTGIEKRAALDSGAIIVAKRGGRVRRVTARRSWSRPVTAASTRTRC